MIIFYLFYNKYFVITDFNYGRTMEYNKYICCIHSQNKAIFLHFLKRK